ncbi:MAG: MFS transporter [Simkaniaceae bacterium]|nr:MFS transporter [Simkaniaceae bacterium]
MVRFFFIMIGNVLYHFDRALFGFLIPFLAPHFFKEGDSSYALLKMYAIIPLSLLMKPLGALFFGSLGDRIGHQKILSITLMGMSVLTILMGCLPLYDQIGTLAPFLLVWIRLGVYFFSAAETTGGAFTLLNQVNPEKRNLWSSLFDASSILGIIIASWSVYWVSQIENGWRSLFLCGGIVGLIGWKLRRGRNGTKNALERVPFQWETLWIYRKQMITIASVAGLSYANYNFITVFMNGFLPLISSISKTEALRLNTHLLLFDMLLLPCCGLLATRWDRNKMIFITIAILSVAIVPLILLLSEATTLRAAAVRLCLTGLGVCLAAPFHAWAYEQAPEKHRLTIGALGVALGGLVFGAPLPMISLWLYQKTGLIVAAAMPIVAIGVMSLYRMSKERLGLRTQS